MVTRRRAYGLRMLVATVAFAAALAPAALAAPALNGEFPVTGKPRHLALGPDGNVWFTESDSTLNREFGKIAPNGAVTEYDSPNDNNNPNGITAGPDGRIWFVEGGGKLVRVDPANPAGAQSFTIAGLADPREITAGPDGNLWAASLDKVLKISTAGVLLNAPGYDVPGMAARGITVGGDGNLWIADFSGRVVKVTTAGVATPYTVGGGPQDVVAGPAGQLAFSNAGANPQVSGRMAYDGTFQETPMPMTDPFGITFGADGAYWTAQFAAQSLGRLSPSGAYTQLALSPGSGPRYVTSGANNTLWVGLETAKKIARVTGVTPPVKPPAPVTPDVTAPALTRLRLAPSRFRVGRGATAVLARARAGTRIRFTLSEAARVMLRIERATAGRVKGGRCVRPTRSLRRAKRCTRWVRAGVLTRDLHGGARSVRFSGRIGKRALKPGRYRVAAVPVDAARNRGARRTARFRIVRR